SLLDAEEIPAGYMYVWDHVGGGGQRANSIVEGLTFKKIGAPGSSLATFYVEGVDLAVSASEPNRYSVVCAGTRVSKTLEYLRDYLMSHRHNDNLSAFLSHTDLLGSDAAVAHGVISSIVGVDDVQILQNKTLVEALIYDAAGPDIMIKAVSDEIVFKDPTDSTFKELGLSSIPDALTGKQAQYVTDANDGTSGIPANSTATADNLLPLNGSGLFPASVIDDGHDNGLDADTLDGQHAPAGTIVGDTDTQTMTNKRLTLPKINSANTTGITSEELETLSGGGDAAGLHTHTADIATPAAYEYADTLASWTSAGTFGWTVPAGVSRMFIAIWGGGGGGGDGGFSKGSGGGGGGGGGFSGLDLIVTPGHSVSVTVGVAGAGGSGTVGSAGGNSSVTINSVQVAYAGGGGAGQLGWTGGAGAGYASFDGSNVYAQEFSGLTFVGSEFFYDNSSKATQLSKGGNGDGGYLYGAAGGSGGWGGNGGNGDGWVYWGNGYHGAAGAAGTNTRFISIMSPNLGGVGGGSGGAPGAGGKGGGRGYNGVAGGAGRVRIYYHA
ncbi:MAG: hypothetical protein KAJ19_23555, partial [Gammaproteobacteria bacterium]|nr:hypothetical protein [Gammaproteobacteria bacterium]